MFPIPDPGRLFPPRLPNRSAVSTPFFSGVLAGASFFAAIGVIIVIANTGWPLWLRIAGGFVGFTLMVGAGSTPAIAGIINGVIYGGLTCLILRNGHSLPFSQLSGAFVFVLFVVMGVLGWRETR